MPGTYSTQEGTFMKPYVQYGIQPSSRLLNGRTFRVFTTWEGLAP